MIVDFPHFAHVHGWLLPRALHMTSYLASNFVEPEAFNSIEIGVHHGKFFLGLENVTPKGGRALAFDVFSQQDLNIDNSGMGNKGVFIEHVNKYAAHPERVEIFEQDSMDIDVASVGKSSFGLISIDGGHTKQHTINDLTISQNLVTSQGIVILDDILNQDWTGVISGAISFFSSPMAYRIVPFAIGFNKLFICHFSYADILKKKLFDDEEILKSFGVKPFKMTTFCDTEIVSLKGV